MALTILYIVTNEILVIVVFFPIYRIRKPMENNIIVYKNTRITKIPMDVYIHIHMLLKNFAGTEVGDADDSDAAGYTVLQNPRKLRFWA